MATPKIPKSLHNPANQFFKNPYTGEDDFIVKLNSLGWTQYGEGKYSTVYENPKKSYVMKVTTAPDEGYAQYVRLIKKYPNKHFPKISDVRKFTPYPKEHYYLYLIEKLIHLKGRACDIIEDDFDNIAAEYELNPNASLEDIADCCMGGKIPNIIKKQPTILQALKIVGRGTRGGSVTYLDMHGHNVMKRSDGTLVITDPYS